METEKLKIFAQSIPRHGNEPVLHFASDSVTSATSATSGNVGERISLTSSRTNSSFHLDL